MLNIEEKNTHHKLLTFSISYGVSIESDIQHSFSEMKDPYIIALILAPEAAQFSNCFAM